jgi:hypothetical protein
MVYLSGSLSNLLFPFLLTIAVYFLVFFKSQSILFLLPPTQDSETQSFAKGIVALIIFEVFSIILKEGVLYYE